MLPHFYASSTMKNCCVNQELMPRLSIDTSIAGSYAALVLIEWPDCFTQWSFCSMGHICLCILTWVVLLWFCICPFPPIPSGNQTRHWRNRINVPHELTWSHNITIVEPLYNTIGRVQEIGSWYSRIVIKYHDHGISITIEIEWQKCLMCVPFVICNEKHLRTETRVTLSVLLNYWDHFKNDILLDGLLFPTEVDCFPRILRSSVPAIRPVLSEAALWFRSCRCY